VGGSWSWWEKFFGGGRGSLIHPCAAMCGEVFGGDLWFVVGVGDGMDAMPSEACGGTSPQSLGDAVGGTEGGGVGAEEEGEEGLDGIGRCRWMRRCGRSIGWR
jgi:hypothetical protein